jgi:hypothetical protein
VNHVLALTRQQFREARVSLLTAVLATTVALGAVHAWFPRPAAVSEASTLAIGVLAALWTLYFASDAFAGDAASGRLTTLSTLPVPARTLWSSRAVFVALASAAQVAWAVGAGYGLQLAFGDARSLAHFEAGLQAHLPWAFALPVLAGAAMLTSLLVDSALAAMVASLLLLGGLALALTPLVRILAVAGVDLEPSVAQAELGASLLAFLILVLGAFAFARGQRRLGARRVRAFHAAWPIATVLLVAGAATAAEHRRRLAVELDNPRTRFRHASASVDGAFVALEVVHDLPGNEDPPPNVWLLDLETGGRDVLARPGQLLDDRYLHFSMPWSTEKPLRVLELSSLAYRELANLLEVTPGEATWSVNTLAADGSLLTSWLATRAVPDWASVEWERDSHGVRSTIVRWSDRGLEARFYDTIPVRSVLPTSVAGRVLVQREHGLVHHEIEGSAETVVFRGETSGAMWPSPSGSAVLAISGDASTAIDAATGAVLHEPWPRAAWVATWIDSSDGARVVEVRPVGAPNAPSRVLDLDAGTSFEIERDLHHALLLRIGSRGYVFVRAGGDLVWVDLEGRLVKVLVER